jgi:archaemetzincin
MPKFMLRFRTTTGFSRASRSLGARSRPHLHVASIAVLAIAACAAAGNRAERLRRESLPPPFESMKRMAKPLGPPGPNDWLTSHREPGQSFADFLEQSRSRVVRRRDTIDVVPIGGFTPARRRVLMSTIDYLDRFYSADVRMRPALLETDLPDSAFRARPELGWRQLSSAYVLEWLSAHRDTHAFATIALSAIDLFPDPRWNFVFGEAAPSNRSGVWSMFRFGDPEASPEAEQLCLLRTMKTASHEIGHLLPIHHCIAYECLMNGSNHLGELDARPLDLCPPCLAKLMSSSAADPVTRSRRLAEFHRAHGFPRAEAVNRAIADLFANSRAKGASR